MQECEDCNVELWASKAQVCLGAPAYCPRCGKESQLTEADKWEGLFTIIDELEDRVSELEQTLRERGNW